MSSRIMEKPYDFARRDAVLIYSWFPVSCDKRLYGVGHVSSLIIMSMLIAQRIGVTRWLCFCFLRGNTMTKNLLVFLLDGLGKGGWVWGPIYKKSKSLNNIRLLPL